MNRNERVIAQPVRDEERRAGVINAPVQGTGADSRECAS